VIQSKNVAFKQGLTTLIQWLANVKAQLETPQLRNKIRGIIRKVTKRVLTPIDGGSSMQPSLNLQVSQGSPNLLAKVQGMTQILLAQKNKRS